MTTFNVVIVKATLAAFDEVTRVVGHADYMQLEQRYKGGGPPFS